jgi:penicillin amidase
MRKIAARAAIAVIAVVVLAVAVIYTAVRGSLPRIAGEQAAGVTAPVGIERDALGIPTITAANRADLAFGTGFAHAQDRFFQMDLSRRLAGGELSELFGAVALEHDRRARLFMFRRVAREVVREATEEQRAVLEAYARGVNAGLASLRSRPWEYWVLQAKPREWIAEDTVMVSFAMWWDLQMSSLRSEIARGDVISKLSPAAVAFLYPRGTSWDAPNFAGETAPTAPALQIPTIDELNVRRERIDTAAPVAERESPTGSNGWAVAGRLTQSGSALVASDMHLNLRVPAVWYRARLRVGSGLDLNGLTLPGAPLLVAGSNGHIAWGFTNSYGDYLDIDVVPCTAVSDDIVKLDSTQFQLQTRPGVIQVKGGENVDYLVRTATQGILYDAQPEKRRCIFVRWLATVAEATNLELLSLEAATSVEQALALAPRIGIPHQNLMVGDREGHIGWTVAGRIPAASGRADLAIQPLAPAGRIRWTNEQQHPRLIDPPSGRVWTANARPIEDAAMEATIGGDEAQTGADYDLSARVHQIRDDLLSIASATPALMSRVQLDSRGQFLMRWQKLALDTLDEKALQDVPRRAALRKQIATTLTNASPDAVSYRLVRAFRNTVERAAWREIVLSLGLDPSETRIPAQFEGPLWEMVTQQPQHLLGPQYPDWRTFLLTQADAMLDDLAEPCPDLAKCTWGARNPVAVRHPLSAALPFGPRLLDMPTVELPGDHDMPRVQDGAFGASNRFAVSPGREAEGYLTIAGGQSGHFLSPFYRAGFQEWAEGHPLPFLPGPAVHRLELHPE